MLPDRNPLSPPVSRTSSLVVHPPRQHSRSPRIPNMSLPRDANATTTTQPSAARLPPSDAPLTRAAVRAIQEDLAQDSDSETLLAFRGDHQRIADLVRGVGGGVAEGLVQLNHPSSSSSSSLVARGTKRRAEDVDPNAHQTFYRDLDEMSRQFRHKRKRTDDPPSRPRSPKMPRIVLPDVETVRSPSPLGAPASPTASEPGSGVEHGPPTAQDEGSDEHDSLKGDSPSDQVVADASEADDEDEEGDFDEGEQDEYDDREGVR